MNEVIEKEFNRLNEEVLKKGFPQLDPKMKKRWVAGIKKAFGLKNPPGVGNTPTNYNPLNTNYSLMLTIGNKPNDTNLTLMREYMGNNSCLGVLMECYIDESGCLDQISKSDQWPAIKEVMNKCSNMYNIVGSYISEDIVELFGIIIPEHFVGYNDTTNLLLLLNRKHIGEIEKFIHKNF